MKTVSIQQLLDHDPDWFWDEPGPWTNAIAEGSVAQARLFLEDLFLEMARLSHAELEDTLDQYPELVHQLTQDLEEAAK